MAQSITIERSLSDIEKSDEMEDIKFEPEDFTEDLEPKKNKERHKKHERIYKISWEYDDRFVDWLIRSPNNLPFCKHCGTELRATGGTQDLTYHMKTRKHIRNSSIAKRELAEEPEIVDCSEIDSNAKDNLCESNVTNYSFEELKPIISEKYYETCKICGDSLPNKNRVDGSEEKLDIKVFEKFDRIEEEKKKIQLEMKLLIDSMEDKKSEVQSPLKSFADMLVADMSKLPNNVQRKLRMDIMRQADAELSKLEIN